MAETCFERDLRILDQCICKLSRADLNGRYRKAFQCLREKIREETNEIIDTCIFAPVIMERILTSEEQEYLQKIADNYRKKLQEQVYRKRSADGFYDILAQAQSEVFAYIREHGGVIDDTGLSVCRKEMTVHAP